MKEKKRIINMETQTVSNAISPVEVRLEGIYKSFPQNGGRLDVLRDVSIDVPAGTFASVVGPSGSGKSTLLAILAGLDQPDRGTITLQPVDGNAPISQRLGQVGYMPQRDLLLPWRSALDNAVAALEVQGISKREAREQAMPLFRQFGLEGFADNYPHELSGGMRQRVSFLRSAMSARGLMLLDEPFGGLDALTRASMQEWLMDAASHLGATVILVTHDVDEAVLLSDRVYVFSSRPARVVCALDIDIPRPRSLEITGDPCFVECRREVLDALRSAGGLAVRVQGGARS